MVLFNLILCSKFKFKLDCSWWYTIANMRYFTFWPWCHFYTKWCPVTSHHVTFALTKFEFAMSVGLEVDALARKCIKWTFTLTIKVTRNAKYPLNAPAKFEVVASNGLRVDAFTRICIFDIRHWPWSPKSRSHTMLPSTLWHPLTCVKLLHVS